METLSLPHRYAVMQNINGRSRQVGVVMANSLTHANTKALRMFNRHVWVERL